VLTKDEVAGWPWVSTDREWTPPIQRDLHFAADECYGWDADTLPQYCRHGLFTALLRCAGWRMAQEGNRFVWEGILDVQLDGFRGSVPWTAWRCKS
jgi:hypothetical protein